MLNTRSFSEILSEMNPATEAESTTSMNSETHWESVLDTQGLSHIYSLTDRYTFQPRQIERLYKIKAKAPAPNHILNSEQSDALRLLNFSINGILQANFSQKQLKQAYRLAVLKTHPDQGGSSESFQEVKKCYQILLTLVKNER